MAVVGSLNLDYFSQVESLPAAGETVTAFRLSQSKGGKGANQAIAAARQGVNVLLIGAVGSDEGGQAYLRALEEEGISTECIRTVAGETGSAFITIDSAGENTIVVAPGANAELRRTDIAREAARIEGCDVLVGQFEVPCSALEEAARLVNLKAIPFILNPSPFHPSFPWGEIAVDYMIVNAGEAELLLNFPPELSSANEVAKILVELRVEHLIVTRGAKETLVFCRDRTSLSIPVLSVLPVDCVGAGDAFTGCFAARIAQGACLESALRAANCAGALTTLGVGAQSPIPNREEVDRHLECLGGC